MKRMKTTKTIKLEQELNEEIKKVSKMISVSQSAFIRMAVIEKINKIKGDK